MRARSRRRSRPSIGWSRNIRRPPSPWQRGGSWTASKRSEARSFLVSSLDLTPEPVRQNLVNQFGAEEIGRDVAGQRAQLDDVAADDPARLDDAAEQRE